MAFSQLALDPAVNITRVPIEKAVDNIHYARVADTLIASIRLGTSADHTTRLEVKEQVWAIRPQVLEAVQQGIISPVTDANDAAVSIAHDRAKAKMLIEMKRYYNGEVSLMGDQWETPAARMRDDVAVKPDMYVDDEAPQDAPRVNPEDLVRDPAVATPVDMMVVLKNLRLLPAPDAARILFLLAGKDENADAILARLPKGAAPAHAHGFGDAVARSLTKAVETIYIKGDVGSLGADAAKVDVNAMPKSLAPFLPLYIKQAAKLLCEANRKDNALATKAQVRIKQIMDLGQKGDKTSKALTWCLQKAAVISEQFKKLPPDGNVSVMGFSRNSALGGASLGPSQVRARVEANRRAVAKSKMAQSKVAKSSARAAIQMDSGYSGGRMGAASYDGMTMGADAYLDSYARPDVTDPESIDHPLVYHTGPNTLPEYHEEIASWPEEPGMAPRDIVEEDDGEGPVFVGGEALPRTAWTMYQAKHNPSWSAPRRGYGSTPVAASALDSVSGWAAHWQRSGAAPTWNAMRGNRPSPADYWMGGGFNQPSYFMQGNPGSFPARYFMAGGERAQVGRWNGGRVGGSRFSHGGGHSHPGHFLQGVNRSPTGIPSNLSPVAAARVVNALVKARDPRARFVVQGIAANARRGNPVASAIASLLSGVNSRRLTGAVNVAVAGLGDMLSGALVGADAILNRRGGPSWA